MKIRKEWLSLAALLGAEAMTDIVNGLEEYESSGKLPQGVARIFFDVVRPMVDADMGKVKEKVKRFVKPTVKEVCDYFLESCKKSGEYWDFDPQAFVDFYEAKGWVIGKSPMKDWKRAVCTWKRSRTYTMTFEQWEAKYNKPKITVNTDELELGEGEVVINGERRYRLPNGQFSKVVVPLDAPKRPSKNYGWSTYLQSWYYLS